MEELSGSNPFEEKSGESDDDDKEEEVPVKKKLSSTWADDWKCPAPRPMNEALACCAVQMEKLKDHLLNVLNVTHFCILRGLV